MRTKIATVAVVLITLMYLLIHLEQAMAQGLKFKPAGLNKH